uniref:Small ribosomal subunit protein mS33 n=1 Tax=Blastobotrys adeninivorans TaxID=409370 RepID=A0A060TEL0_BLAAD
MLNPPKSRMLQLVQLSKTIFRESFNPDNKRTGAKVLRERLKGPLIRNYYMPRPPTLTLRHLRKIDPEPNHYDEDEYRRVQNIAARKRKGKGKPTKSKEAASAPAKGKKKK